ncbi:MAG: hypothetical protein KGJ23_09950 [Euryarchaeota archaeon]|nr:hypothetical protein [Euryarchaeota archaeon]MDE1836926.1 hypothetical protein [Euryarchaeota archaeon]MDE1881522.1 hypothetical protein [Euryarchaeota archaeon]MDE2045089.1 hypothetical protein [Thermoplasmata archaeon]
MAGAFASRRTWVVPLLLLVAGGLAVASVAFPFWENWGRGTDGTTSGSTWSVDGACYGMDPPGWACQTYPQYLAYLGSDAQFIEVMVATIYLAGGLALSGALVSALAASFVIREGRRGLTSGLNTGRRRVAIRVGAILLVMAAAAVPIGVEVWLAQSDARGPGNCTVAFFSLCGTVVATAGPGWFMLVAAAALGAAALLQVRREARRAGPPEVPSPPKSDPPGEGRSTANAAEFLLP